MILDKIEIGTVLNVSWQSNSMNLIVSSMLENRLNCICHDNNRSYKLDVIPEDFSGHKKQNENFTLKNDNDEILSIDVKVYIVQ